jgi:hypothetical protein
MMLDGEEVKQGFRQEKNGDAHNATIGTNTYYDRRGRGDRCCDDLHGGEQG